ncbi:MAG: amino acid carrier protein [Myxococcales bacterium]|nr:amino acid carrier protein [Myxococcales bacterium]
MSLLAFTFLSLVGGEQKGWSQLDPAGFDDASAVIQLQKSIDRVDPIFARNVVTPIASVLFYDIAFWDNGRSDVWGVGFSETNVVSAGADGELLVWSEGTVKQRWKMDRGPIHRMIVRPGQPHQVVVVWLSGDIGLIDLETGEIVGTYPKPSALTSALAFDSTGTWLLAGAGDGRLWLWSEEGVPPQEIYSSPHANDELTALAVRGVAPQVTVAWASGSQLFHGPVVDGKIVSTALKGHRRGVNALAFGPNGRLASGGEDGRVILYPPGGMGLPTVVALSEEPVVAIVDANDTQLLVGRPNGVQVVQQVEGKWKEEHLFKTMVNTLALRDDQTILTVGGHQGQVGVFDLTNKNRIYTLDGHATEMTLPFIVLWLVLGAIFFTLRFSFVNLRAFGHAIAVTRGAYDGHSEDGDVSHFQALAMALSATVGLGNIAGVAVAVGTGGPGAVFWMIMAGFLGMSSKFAECTLGQMYRTTDSNGKVSGGPMHYLKDGLAELKLAPLGRVLSVLFAVLCIGGSLGGGNMFQANQSYAQVALVLPVFQGEIGALVYGLILSGLVGIVIIGGIDRIGQVASFIVPFMVGVYLCAALFILGANISQVPQAFVEIVNGAFTPGAAYGGALGVMVTGFRRAAFSNEAGVGSAPIVHSAAATDEPVREGIVALLEPFIDTIVVCTTTALVLVVTGVYKTKADGVEMTSNAFETVLPWFPGVLTVAVFLFAFSTMISWSYYGERCWCFLFGDSTTLIYKVIFVGAVVVGSVIRLGSVLDFSDLMILAMAFPNMLGAVLLSGKVRSQLNNYLRRLRSGEMAVSAEY